MTTETKSIENIVDDSEASCMLSALPEANTPSDVTKVTDIWWNCWEGGVSEEQLKGAANADKERITNVLLSYFHDTDSEHPYQSSHNISYDLLEGICLNLSLPVLDKGSLKQYLDKISGSTNTIIPLHSDKSKDLDFFGYILNRENVKKSSPVAIYLQVDFDHEDHKRTFILSLVERIRHKKNTSSTYFDVAAVSKNGDLYGFMGKYFLPERTQFTALPGRFHQKLTSVDTPIDITCGNQLYEIFKSCDPKLYRLDNPNS